MTEVVNITDEIVKMNSSITKIVEENRSLQHMKKRYIEYGQRINEIAILLKDTAKKLNDLGNEINPQIILAHSRKQFDYSEIDQDVYDKMSKGTQFTSELLMSSFGISANQNFILISKLSKMKDVKKVKDGKLVRLYI